MTGTRVLDVVQRDRYMLPVEKRYPVEGSLFDGEFREYKIGRKKKKNNKCSKHRSLLYAPHPSSLRHQLVIPQQTYKRIYSLSSSTDTTTLRTRKGSRCIAKHSIA